jgi:16S rRNA A1518/A1519 N6-dimethyltransferase RsmA/KsgA/DIM1 with predicted DNA glycosylase/AP lyase activity
VLLIIFEFFLIAGVILGAVMVAMVTLLPLIHGAPFVRSADDRLKNILKLSQVKKGEKAADIGAGDGKIVIALARAGAEAHGYEINPILVKKGQKKIRELGLEGKAFMHLQSMWKVDYSPYSLITIYGTTYIMHRMERKLDKDLKKGTKVVSNYFTFPNWEPAKKLDQVLLYVV